VLLAKYSKHDVTLSDFQHEEMCNIVSQIEEKHGNELEEVYKKASGFCSIRFHSGSMTKKGISFTLIKLKTVSYMLICTIFENNFSVGHGKRGNRWNLVTI